MALEDFLGSTSEIKIIDFFAENLDMVYNQTEISECLNISRTTVNKKIPELIYNNIVEIKERAGNTKKYGLKKNSLVSSLIDAMYDHSFRIAEYEKEEKEIISEISKECLVPIPEYCKCECGEITLSDSDNIKRDYQHSWELNTKSSESQISPWLEMKKRETCVSA